MSALDPDGPAAPLAFLAALYIALASRFSYITSSVVMNLV